MRLFLLHFTRCKTFCRPINLLCPSSLVYEPDFLLECSATQLWPQIPHGPKSRFSDYGRSCSLCGQVQCEYLTVHNINLKLVLESVIITRIWETWSVFYFTWRLSTLLFEDAWNWVTHQQLKRNNIQDDLITTLLTLV